MNTKSWKENNTLLREGTFDYSGRARGDKNIYDTWFFKKSWELVVDPEDYGIYEGEDLYEDDQEILDSLNNLKRTFRESPKTPGCVIIPAGTQIDHLDEESPDKYHEWFYLNGDKNLKCLITADMWCFEVSPIIGKKLSDEEKARRLAARR